MIVVLCYLGREWLFVMKCINMWKLYIVNIWFVDYVYLLCFVREICVYVVGFFFEVDVGDKINCVFYCWWILKNGKKSFWGVVIGLLLFEVKVLW